MEQEEEAVRHVEQAVAVTPYDDAHEKELERRTSAEEKGETDKGRTGRPTAPNASHLALYTSHAGRERWLGILRRITTLLL